MKPKTDRELVEYLDESAKWHELTREVDENGWAYCYCGKISCASHNPTPTLEWMLGRLRFKGYLIKFSPYGADGVICIVHKPHSQMRDISIALVGGTETLALRGAVCKMIESEEGKGC